ncbi:MULTISPECIES: phage baseplate protein [unclassified Paenibacillus]|uniref:phage baseplate protein n=1 Tax=unclassified Paenibacillus TaxID=185978 RepID=UPI000955112A|nr:MULTISPECIES: hypothetical protein [unclassified Paenibacillus]ASS66373.1 hypothetical protein CIC07_09575 [Paenibacillus sp. RUD330]SIQ06399.1 hypothetical protein SAMN05880555_0506 [Paenibacillus sp. RU4X]SIQ26518.1 hypothetical protein SAMN05880570_0505 [Paenibacillus sp. RU4T]
MAKLDGYYIQAETESSGFSAEITEQPVEQGVSLTDHVQRGPRSLSVSGRVVGPQAAEIHKYLMQAYEGGKLVQYTGRVAFRGLIASFSSDRNYSVADGFTYSLELREVLIAKAGAYQGELPAPVKVQAKIINSAGTKQTKTKSGQVKDKTKDKTKAKATKKPPQVVTFKPGSKWATPD